MNSKGLTILKCVNTYCWSILLFLFICSDMVIMVYLSSKFPLCYQIYFGTGSPDTVDVPVFNHSHAKVDLPGSLTLLYENVPDENMYQVCMTEYRERHFRISPPCINFKYNQTICRPQDHESCLSATLVYETGQSPIFGLSILETTSNSTMYVLMDSKSAEYDIYWISPTEFNTLSSIWYARLDCSFKVWSILASSTILGIGLLCFCGFYCCHLKLRRRIGVLREQLRRMQEEEKRRWEEEMRMQEEGKRRWEEEKRMWEEEKRMWEEQKEVVSQCSEVKNTVEQQEETNATASTRIIVPKLNIFDSPNPSVNSVGSRSSSSSRVSFQSSTQSVNSGGSGSSISAIEDTNEDVRPPPFACFDRRSVFEDITQQGRGSPDGMNV